MQLQIELIEEKFITLAAEIAKKSLCKKRKCGAVLVGRHGQVIGTGYNAPPLDDLCNQKCDYVFPANREKPKSDCTCCIHAEWRALFAALGSGADVVGSTMYFASVDDNGVMLPSGDPYCTVCSRITLDSRVSFWVLHHEDGPKIYGAKNYNDLSYKFHQKQKSLN